MSFQDELRAHTKTPEELIKEQEQKRYKKLQREANDLLNSIKIEMNYKVANADYIEQDGKRIVVVKKWINSRLYGSNKGFVTHKRSADHKEKTTGSFSQNNFHIELVYKVYLTDDPDRFDFLDILQQEAEKDSIHTEPIITYQYEYSDNKQTVTNENYREIALFHFPIDFTLDLSIANPKDAQLVLDGDKRIDEVYCNNNDFHLCIKATCEIPDYCNDEEKTEKEDDTSISDEDNTLMPDEDNTLMPDEDNTLMPDEDNTLEEETIVHIDNIKGVEFEQFCADLLIKNGFENVTRTQDTADQGIDIIAQKDGVEYAIQCKNYTADVGNAAVQQAYAGKDFYRCHVGVVLTNRFFTKSAHELADRNGIILWDRYKLIELSNNAGYKVSE